MVYTIVLGCMFFRDATFFRDNNTIPGVLGAATLVVVDRFFWAVVECRSALLICRHHPWPSLLLLGRRFQRIRRVLLYACARAVGPGGKHAARVFFYGQNTHQEGTRRWYVLPLCGQQQLAAITRHPWPGFCFAILLAVVAPGGSNYIVAGAILIEMNPSNLKGQARLDKNVRIGTICLFGNALISAFNLLGIWFVWRLRKHKQHGDSLPLMLATTVGQRYNHCRGY